MSDKQQTYSPLDDKLYVERELGTLHDVDKALGVASVAQKLWKRTPLAERLAVARRAMAVMRANREEWGLELTWQMGRPIRYTPKEIDTCADRGDAMIDLAEEGLADVVPPAQAGTERFIRREPLGVVLVVPAWNYPFLIAVNSIVPALVAGNSVVLKHSAQTPLVAERFKDAFDEAGLPPGVLQVLHLDHAVTAQAIADARVDFVAFTGSVGGGHAMVHAAQDRFVGIGLELGGKDPAYVRADADVPHAVENLVDGSFFNSGQSCCGIERIYVHEDVYDEFVAGFAELTKGYVLGDPRDEETTLGPLAKKSGADLVRKHIAEAVEQGARALIDPGAFERHSEDGNYLAPQVLVDVTHDMAVMKEESFGPVVGIMKVSSDDEAVTLMNDSAFGLTASVWTRDEAAALALGQRVETGTFFMNRCDFLDPQLAWVGVKDSGRGCTLSRVGYEHLTRPKSFHLRTQIG
jgi:acyl-CoA reductase-like NAD-dependent aldehyde dehydrogenase